MQLIKYENFSITISDEAYLIRPIRRMFMKDRTKEKEQFFQYMSILYFVYDPRSIYSYIVDEKSRLEEVLLQEGIDPNKFKIDKEFQEVIDIYQKIIETPSSKALKNARKLISDLEDEMGKVKISAIVEEEKKVVALKNLAALGETLPKLAKNLINIEKEVINEITETSKARGNKELTVTDNGLQGLF